MHATLLTLILVTGAPACDERTSDQDSQHTKADAAQGDGNCDACNQSDDRRRHHHRLFAGAELMPQSCYGPAYGCYPGNDRRIQRYPAFHGWYYRKPYNYRNEFDYPWHAGLHEPTSLFSYNVVSETTNGADQSLPSSIDNNAAPPPPQRMSSRSGNASSVITPQRSLSR